VYVVADLKQNQEYTITAGNPKYKLPNYDLAHFTDKYLIPNNLPEVKITQIKHENPKPQTAITKPFWQQSWFMWLCIGIGGLTILIFSNSLVKDLKNNS
jgi:hypothetical protein